MKFIVLFQDNPSAPNDVRQTHMAAHLDFLEQVGIETAGPLQDDEANGRDGLWVLDAESKAQVERLIRQDPFWPTGLRASYSILAWRQVFANGSRT